MNNPLWVDLDNKQKERPSVKWSSAHPNTANFIEVSHGQGLWFDINQAEWVKRVIERVNKRGLK